MAKKNILIGINNYWLDEFYFLEEDYPICFICGKESHLEICHLTPKSLGGSNNVDNLVLLCKRCHSKAPNLKNKEIMIKYIHKRAKDYDGFFHMEKVCFDSIAMSFSKIYKRLEKVSTENNLTLQPNDILMFLEHKLKENSIYIQSHFDANDQTKASLMEYLSTYKNLEVDFLAFKLRLLGC